jgi:hypothetical protein
MIEELKEYYKRMEIKKNPKVIPNYFFIFYLLLLLFLTCIPAKIK